MRLLLLQAAATPTYNAANFCATEATVCVICCSVWREDMKNRSRAWFSSTAGYLQGLRATWRRHVMGVSQQLALRASTER